MFELIAVILFLGLSFCIVAVYAYDFGSMSGYRQREIEELEQKELLK